MAKKKEIRTHQFYEEDVSYVLPQDLPQKLPKELPAGVKLQKPKPLDSPDDPIYLSWRTFTHTHQGESNYVRAYALKAWYEHEKHTYAGWTSLMEEV